MKKVTAKRSATSRSALFKVTPFSTSFTRPAPTRMPTCQVSFGRTRHPRWSSASKSSGSSSGARSVRPRRCSTSDRKAPRPKSATTYFMRARLAEPLTFVTNEEVEEVIAAIIATYRGLGDRTDRKRARMKYVVADLGLGAFQCEVEQRLGRTLRAPLELPDDFDAVDHLGWRVLPNGTWQVGIRVGAGRVKDVENGVTLKSALREIAERFAVTFFITAQQDIIVSGVLESDRHAIDALLREHHVRLNEELGAVERHAMACPALPTCGQALTEAERVLPTLVSGLEDALARRALGRRPLQLRMTGCPNGCARPAIAEIGVVGRTKATYDVYVGGGTKGNRLATLFQEKVKLDDIPEVLGPLFDRWGSEAETEESFGDFVTC